MNITRVPYIVTTKSKSSRLTSVHVCEDLHHHRSRPYTGNHRDHAKKRYAAYEETSDEHGDSLPEVGARLEPEDETLPQRHLRKVTR